MTSATSALAAAKTSELTLVARKCRLRMTASKLPRPISPASWVGPAMVRLPWIRNRNGGSTSAQRMTIRRTARIACWRAESRAQRPLRASVAAMWRTCARSADVVKDGPPNVLMPRYCTLWHGLAQSATQPQGVGWPRVSPPFVPAKSGDPGPSTHAFQSSGSPLPRGRTENVCSVRIHIFDSNNWWDCEVVFKRKKIGPCTRLWASGSPLLSSVSLAVEGVGAPTGAVPGIAPGGCPDYSGRMGVKRHAPRLAARQRGILAFMPLTVVGPGRVIVPHEAARVRPGDEVASSIARRCRSRSPPTERLRKAPLEEWIGIGAA